MRKKDWEGVEKAGNRKGKIEGRSKGDKKKCMRKKKMEVAKKTEGRI